jgi:hypothetical protein
MLVEIERRFQPGLADLNIADAINMSSYSTGINGVVVGVA